MDVVVALLPSTLLGPAVWRPVAGHLADGGWRAVIAAATPTATSTPDGVLASFLDALPRDQRLVLVPHSNAGVYVPALTASRDVHGYVFVDARLPAARGHVNMTTPGTFERIRGKAGGDGLVPPWTEWWDDVAGLFPDAAVRQEVEREQPRLPLSYFTGTLPVQSGWDSRPGAYLAFGDTYQPEQRAAAHRGWPVSTLAGEHLHMLQDPGQVAMAIGDLLKAIGFRPEPRQRPASG